MFPIILFFLFLTSAQSFAAIDPANPFPLNKSSQYAYSEPPEICFFPLEKSAWNGYKVTNWDWKKLTDYQKVKFVQECAVDIIAQERVNVRLENTMEVWLGLVKLINQSLSQGKADGPPAERFPMYQYYEQLLRMKGVIWTQDGEQLKPDLGQIVSP